MGKSDGSDLIKDKNFQNLLDKMNKDADVAEKQWKMQMANAVFGYFPSDFLQEYKNDGNTMIKARATFTAEWKKVLAGKGDVKKLMTAYDSYSGWLEALFEKNAWAQAIIDTKLGPKVEAIVGLLEAFGNMCKGRLSPLEDTLEELQAEIQEADKELTKGEAKAYLNAIISAITLLLAPEGALARGFITSATAGITGHVLVEVILGKRTAKGTAVAIGGDVPDMVKKFSEAQAKFAGAVGAFLAAKFDADEIGEALDKLEELYPKVQDARAKVDQAKNALEAQRPYLEKVTASLDALEKEMDKAEKIKVSAPWNYDVIMSTMKKTN
jgi:DNA repair ATPase RecN